MKSGKVIGDLMSQRQTKDFLKFLRNIDKAVIARQEVHLPDYHVCFEDADDMVVFTNRGTMSPALLLEGRVPPLKPESYERAREVAPGWDVRHLEGEWRDWIVEPPRDVDAAFIGFCRKWFDRRGRP